jgi:NAD(P)-dependent dehydrogenase (short-subunit alcohol dehydrogenase family)
MTTSALFDIRGKVALVSGASGALGSAVARGLADAGARVMLTGRDPVRLTPLAEAIARDGGSASVAGGDPTDPDAVRAVVEATVGELGGVDILVTAAGMNAPAPIIEQELQEWDAIVDSQLKATWLLCKEAGRAMLDAGRGGKVVLVGSQRGALGMANYSAYCPAKAAVHLLARSLACEWGPHGIQVNCLAPGLFRSDLTAWMWEDREVSTRMLARVPHGRLGEPADFVGPVIFLASAASDWMTGAILHVDGGYTAG